MVEATEDLIPRLAALGVNYVLLDGNLSPGEHSGYEGRSLAAQIRKNAPSVKIVGFSAVDQDYVDIPLGKGNIHKNLRAVFLGE